MSVVLLGIDPGSRVTGYGVIRMQGSILQYVSSGCVRVGELDTAQRLQQIFSGIRQVITQYAPEEIAIEQIFMHENPSAALKLGQARGVAIVAATLEGYQIAEYSAREIKQAIVGYGAADKNQMQQMIRTLLKLSGLPAVDAADALAVAICHAHTRYQAGGIKRGKFPWSVG
jgi:crossover junction endodeoxyribonuclease RuvC